MHHAPVVVYAAAGWLQANIVKGMLEAAEIPVQLSGEGIGSVYGFALGPLGLVEILVPAERAAEAEGLIAAMERGEIEGSTSPPSESESPPGQ